MMKAIMKRVLLYSVMWIVLSAGCSSLKKNYLFVDSYVAVIDTPSNSNTEFYLKHFNSLGDGNAVDFNNKSKKGRPIYIMEADALYSSTAIGQARVALTYCRITMLKGLPDYLYYTTLVHEYMHCLGYDHVDIEEDVMYPSVNIISEENIKGHAQEIKKRRNKWKSLRN